MTYLKIHIYFVKHSYLDHNNELKSKSKYLKKYTLTYESLNLIIYVSISWLFLGS